MAFAQAFTTVYKDTIPKLNDLDAYVVAGWLATPLASLQEPVQRVFDQRRPKGNIELPEAVDLVHAYALFDAYRSFEAIDEALKAISRQAMARRVGARGLRMILEELMLDLMYHLPSQKKVKEFEVTREMVEKRSVTLAMMDKAG